eukprot:TRINITY_DN69404_c0_g1_i1.p1 TRINITY_DN69404_c0_g1~~TRINITY_DN69404_c0_g1_i1.p1  ORF type:complete len:279 (-),score=53.01 TRINITY_DN69404_c0_g1_i1:63-899(-)
MLRPCFGTRKLALRQALAPDTSSLPSFSRCGPQKRFAAAAESRAGALPSTRGRYFTKTHEWFQVEDEGVGTVGITQVAQRSLGEVVFCRLPREGERFKVMDTIATLEALKTVGEVKSPVQGEVLEINPRLLRQPALVTHAPLTDGWLLRMAFDGRVPRYLRRSGAISRAEVEHLLADIPGLARYLQERLLPDAAEAAPEANTLEEKFDELTFEGLRTIERLYIHKAAEELGLYTVSHGTGAGRQLVVRRQALEDVESQEGNEDTHAEEAPSERRVERR